MESYVTSYSGLFDYNQDATLNVNRIEIPLIQRDYAQGRKGEAVERIRADFLQVLRTAVLGGEPISLDFVYGGVENGTLLPLDGQQRLTTLFLLHWYLGCRADKLDGDAGWKRFSYATRPSARLFCERLVEYAPPDDCEHISDWLRDQAWFQYTWSHDPTVQAMLIMLDDMHEMFADVDAEKAWTRLVDRESPAISFHLLPMRGSEFDEDRYIKMNSRGKPLTPFENFKAWFEQLLKKSCPERVDEFAAKVDRSWADILWKYHGGDYLVDDEFLRYFHFVTEVMEWRLGTFTEGDLWPLAESVYGPDNPDASDRIDFLIRAFDAWKGVDIEAFFESIFATELDPHTATPRPVIYGTERNLFEECCNKYGEGQGRRRKFSFGQSIYLYGALWHLLHDTAEPARRLRILRNLVDASDSELRGDKMHLLLQDTEKVMATGSVAGLEGFNQAQAEDEERKAHMLFEQPDIEGPLFLLEDEPTLRGSLAAFEIDAAILPARRDAFHAVMVDNQHWPALTGALLATGDYSRRSRNKRFFQFGSSKRLGAWREILAGVGREGAAKTRAVLDAFLEDFADRSGNVADRLQAIAMEYVDRAEADQRLDWRAYLVKYRCMREGNSGIYVGRDGALGFSICMLRRTQMNSNYRDPYLLAVYREVNRPDRLEDPWFTGYETNERWLRLTKSGIQLRCVNEGFLLEMPSSAARTIGFGRVSEAFGVEDQRLAVPQTKVDETFYDTRDRIGLAAEFVSELIRNRL